MQRLQENIYRWLITILAFASLIFLIGIILFLFKESAPLFKQVGIGEFLLGTSWYPTHEEAEFGILTLIAASFWVTLGALLVCVPLGVGSALYIHELASDRQKSLLKPMIEILSSIPSVVYGFFGMVVAAPILQKIFHLPTGLCAFTASLILGIMAVPMVTTIAEDALACVPISFREASLAVGANRWQTLTQVVLPAAGSGISTAIILGMSRAIGETMTVLMVAGGAAVIPTSFFDPVRPMTSTIAAEMGEAVMGSLHYNALFSIGLVLFLITLVFNICAELISRRFRINPGMGR